MTALPKKSYAAAPGSDPVVAEVAEAEDVLAPEPEDVVQAARAFLAQ